MATVVPFPSLATSDDRISYHKLRHWSKRILRRISSCTSLVDFMALESSTIAVLNHDCAGPLGGIGLRSHRQGGFL